MAEDQDESEKTEEPTQRRLEEARKKGDVAKSQEIPGWFVLASGLALLIFLLPAASGSMAVMLRAFLQHSHEYNTDPSALLGLMQSMAWQTTLIMAFPVLVIAIAGLAGHLVQTGWLVSGEKIQPKLSKINPVEGFKRNFGPQGLANFLKGIGKMALVAAAAFIVIWPKKDQLASLPLLEVEGMLSVVRQAAIELMIAALVVYALIAIADFAFQRQSFIKRNRMSKRDIKDELKNTEGDPHVRARLRQLRQERAQKRMMAAVPDASVVITNPTHYAIALHYEQGETSAPVVTAMGVDDVALRIREVAEDHDVPIVEDPPLARALWATAEIDEPIPTEQFQAVAKVIGYVLTLAQGKRATYRPTG